MNIPTSSYNPRILAARIMGMAKSEQKTIAGRLNTAKARQIIATKLLLRKTILK